MKETIKQTPPHVLVVDDDEIIREAALETLTAAGFIVSEVENGALAIQALENLRPDIILLDVMMPVMDGFETASAIRRMTGNEGVPILIMTALDDLDSINRAFQAGATDFITKPLNWVILVERIRFMARAVRVMKAQQQLRIELIQAQKMEALGTLAGTVAHDLNNVLSGIVSYPDMLLYNLSADSPLRKPILTIQNAGQKAAAIVNDLLTLARRSVKVREVFNLNDIITEYLRSPEYTKFISFHQNISVETHLEPNLHNTAGSATHIRKTIMNLVSNAAEAQPTGGQITISTYHQLFGVSHPDGETTRNGEFVALKVDDKGCGIAKQDVDRIFEPFYTKKVMGRSGTGLGMAVVWGTVQDHQGYIDIESIPNEGTTFLLYFPVSSEAKAKEAEALPTAAYRGDGQVVLIIDDAKEQREIAAGILEILNYRPVAVSSGEKAIAYLKNHTVDLILLDMIMPPGMDGLETYKKILATRPDQKAIVTSGYAETERVKKVLKLGAGTFVKKPYTMETIGIAIKTEIRNRPETLQAHPSPSGPLK